MSTDLVVYLHGIWMPGEEMLLLQRHLQAKHALPGKLFHYPSVRGSLDENAELLADFVRDEEADRLHLVAHSLGGVVALRMLSLNPDLTTGRVVCLGSPLCGSRAANFLHGSDWGNLILGKTITDGVVAEAANEWATDVTAKRDVGIIAGTVPVGLGRLVAKFDEDNDGTVAVSETQLPGAKDHLRMAVSHSGLVLSTDVADQCAHFIVHGAFQR